MGYTFHGHAFLINVSMALLEIYCCQCVIYLRQVSESSPIGYLDIDTSFVYPAVRMEDLYKMSPKDHL